MFARGADNQLWHKWYESGAWSDWESLGGVLASDPEVIALTSPGTFQLTGGLRVYVTGMDGKVWAKKFRQGFAGGAGVSGICTARRHRPRSLAVPLGWLTRFRTRTHRHRRSGAGARSRQSIVDTGIYHRHSGWYDSTPLDSVRRRDYLGSGSHARRGILCSGVGYGSLPRTVPVRRRRRVDLWLAAAEFGRNLEFRARRGGAHGHEYRCRREHRSSSSGALTALSGTGGRRAGNRSVASSCPIRMSRVSAIFKSLSVAPIVNCG